MKTLIKLLSYLWDVPIEKTSSKQNDYLEVIWTNGKKMLNTRYANFSFGNGYKVFEKACSLIDHEIEKAKNVLILGFGCGSIHQILRTEHNYTQQIHGIEYDAEIISLFWKHFAPQNASNLSVECEDASSFIATNQKQYDIIFIDLFEELNNVDFIFQSQFLKNLIQAKPNSLVFNLTAQNKEDEQQISDLVLRLSSEFKDVSNTSFQDLNQIVIAK